MSRTIKTAAVTEVTEAAQPPDGYKERLLKYIPAEVITLYMALSGVVGAAAGASSQAIAHWTIFGVALVVTPLYQLRILKITNRTQILISTGAFLVWSFALGGPFEQVIKAADLKMWGSMAVALYTFLVPFVEPAP
ncbi:MAG TPA: hypothetical protein VGQ76_14680 [Thermoanaerobaculia bacterium]|jgi:membrane-bound ClpP family serine protease|nr:hypothetical protein [Thermoanaerobaculia bacterium]